MTVLLFSLFLSCLWALVRSPLGLVGPFCHLRPLRLTILLCLLFRSSVVVLPACLPCVASRIFPFSPVIRELSSLRGWQSFPSVGNTLLWWRGLG